MTAGSVEVLGEKKRRLPVGSKLATGERRTWALGLVCVASPIVAGSGDAVAAISRPEALTAPWPDHA